MNRALPERIFICGFMGTGKTTVGKQLASKLDMPFHDLDAHVENQVGQTIADIFEAYGEEEFRKKEKAALLNIIRTKKGVVALGGGSLHNQHLVDHIKVNGLLVFINTPMEEIVERISSHKNRPLLLDEKGEMKPKPVLQKQMQQLYEERLIFYEQAEVTIHAQQYESMSALVNQLAKKIRYHVALH